MRTFNYYFTLLSFVFSLIAQEYYAQSADWSSIRSIVNIEVNLPDEFGIPYIQPHHNHCREDGLFLSREGLHLCVACLPADLISYTSYAQTVTECPVISTYVKESLLSMNTITFVWGSTSVLHSDIIYTSRTNKDIPFNNWRLSNLA